MIKRFEDYVKAVTKAINEDSPAYGMTITEVEVRRVLKYYMRNFKTVLQRYQSEIKIEDKMWIFNVRHSVSTMLSHRKSRQHKKNI